MADAQNAEPCRAAGTATGTQPRPRHRIHVSLTASQLDALVHLGDVLDGGSDCEHLADIGYRRVLVRLASRLREIQTATPTTTEQR